MYAELYSGPSQTSKMQALAKVLTVLKPEKYGEPRTSKMELFA